MRLCLLRQMLAQMATLLPLSVGQGARMKGLKGMGGDRLALGDGARDNNQRREITTLIFVAPMGSQLTPSYSTST
uniref:Secreted protein n=1 Tax=Knipowitschia caucasica TaxID=637954 RepID=A0AAV2JQ76_KNICA